MHFRVYLDVITMAITLIRCNDKIIQIYSISNPSQNKHGDFIYMHMFWPFIALAVGCDCDPADAETSSPDKTSVSTYSQSVHGGSMRKERHLRGQSELKDAEGPEPEPNRIAMFSLRFNIGTPCKRLRKPTKESERASSMSGQRLTKKRNDALRTRLRSGRP